MLAAMVARLSISTVVTLGALLLAAAPAAAAPGFTAQAPPLDWLALAMGMIAGLALFLYGVDLLASSLKEAAGGRMQALIERSSRNRVAGLAGGAAACVALDSSSVTIILLIALVDAGLLPFAQALPVVLGANIGTTMSSQIFAWNIDVFAPVLIAAALIWKALARADAGRRAATVLLGLGLVLFGLSLMGDAAEPLESQPAVVDWLKRLENPLLGVAAGAVVTVALQSSSAMMGIVIALAGSGVISLPAGVAIMLGAEIGTCADTLLATIGRSRAAVRTGLFQLLFNFASAAVGVLLVDQLVRFGTATADSTAQQIANAHVMFNVAGALIALPFTSAIARGLERLIPERAPPVGEPAVATA